MDGYQRSLLRLIKRARIEAAAASHSTNGMALEHVIAIDSILEDIEESISGMDDGLEDELNFEPKDD